MKKLAAILCAVSLFSLPKLSYAAYSQYNIYNSIQDAYAWMEENASPLSSTDYAAADYYITAVARMGFNYNYSAYVNRAETRPSSTYTDAQRLVIATTACGSVWNENALREYTYKNLRDNPGELAGALITLDCGGYKVPEGSNINRDHIIVTLLSMQRPDGSFEGDVYTTARAVTALAPYINTQYKLSTGEHKNAEYTYSTQSVVLNAIHFLEGAKGGDCGYGTVTNTANVIIALDAVGVSADADPGFVTGNLSPLSWLKSQQAEDGSFNGSAYDTALAMCAMTSHLRAMQGLSRFYDFTANDTVDISAAESGDPHDLSGDSSKTEVKKAVITEVSPPAPDEKTGEYGPFPFVGPVQSDENSNPTPEPVNETATPEPAAPSSAKGWAIVIIAALILVAAGNAFVITLYGPKLREIIKKIIDKTKK